MDGEIHYLSYDPEQIWLEMMTAYLEAGGSTLFPGDEKEITLRSAQAVIMQVFAGVDAALRMATLRYAAGDYLDLYGEGRSCSRHEAQAATATVEIAFRATGVAKTIPAGTAMTADGAVMYLLAEAVEQSGLAQTVQAAVVCREAGSGGNSLLAGTQLHMMIPNPAVSSITALTDAAGGQDREEDEAYRARIRTHGLTALTTGTKEQYEQVTMGVSSQILDAEALALGAGEVGVYLLLAEGAEPAGLIASVTAALGEKTSRPLTDMVTVAEAEALPYVLNVQYAQEENANMAAAAAAAAAEYQAWQDEVIGRAFNPDKLMAMLYQAGATRVIWGEGSEFSGGEVAYTAIPAGARCKGTISLAVMNG